METQSIRDSYVLAAGGLVEQPDADFIVQLTEESAEKMVLKTLLLPEHCNPQRFWVKLNKIEPPLPAKILDDILEWLTDVDSTSIYSTSMMAPALYPA